MGELKLPVEDNEEELTSADPLNVSRRWLLLKVGALFNAVVGVAVAVPVIKYLLSPLKPDDAYKSWVSLGSIDTFPVGETRLATARRSSVVPRKAETTRTGFRGRRPRTIPATRAIFSAPATLEPPNFMTIIGIF